MTPLTFTLLAFAASVAAGLLGSLLGLGGGIIVIPVLTLLMGVNIRYAIGASIVSVIAPSSGAAAAYVRERMTNLRVATLLELGTTTGALTAAYLAGHVAVRWLFVVFALVMGYSAVAMFRKRRESPSDAAGVPPDRLSDRLRLHGSYFDESAAEEVAYCVTRAPLGLALMYVAGIVSGPARHRVEGAEGAGDGPGDAAADQGLDGDQQLHDRRHRRRERGRLLRAGRIDPFVAAPFRPGRSVP